MITQYLYLTAAANSIDNLDVSKYELLKKSRAFFASSSFLNPTKPIWRLIPLYYHINKLNSTFVSKS